MTLLSEFRLFLASGPHRGNVLVLTFFFIVLLTLEVTVVNLIAQRSLGEGAILSTQNIAARYAQTAAFNRIEQDLNAYILTNGTTNITTAFAKGGASEIDETLDVTNPETGSSETGSVNIQAWLVQRRGVWYKLAARAQVSDIDLVAYRWVKLNPCSTSDAGAAGVLTTILAGTIKVNHYAMAVTDTGRVYFGDDDASPVDFWTWSKSTGLSTVAHTSTTRPGHYSTRLNPAQDRVYFGSDEATPNSHFWTYSPATGLSTILTARPRPGRYATYVAPNGRLFFGENMNSTAVDNFYTWTTTDGLSTIVTNVKGPGHEHAMIADNTGRIFFGTGNCEYPGTNPALSWSTTTGLSTILRPSVGSFYAAGCQGALALTTGNTFVFADNNTNTYIHRWAAATGLSTIDPIATGDFPMQWSTVTASNGRVYFGEWPGATTGRMMTFLPATGLSTILTGKLDPGVTNPSQWPTYPPDYFYLQRVGVDANNRVYFMDDSTNGTLWTWAEGAGLSTILVGGATSKVKILAGSPTSGRVAFGSSSNTWTWSTATGLSTVGAPADEIHFDNNDHLYFLSNTAGVFTWDATTGLSTVYVDAGQTHKTLGVSATSGPIFFQTYGKNYYAWQRGSSLTSCSARHYLIVLICLSDKSRTA
ncbi:MAG: hypothetical protein AB7P76_08780 [Candidatus Melainabacteria bacterium]